VKVVDFGIAKASGEDGLTSPGIFKGKLAYASPEQVRGEPLDRRTDVFSVGVMLWEAIAMRRFAPGVPTRATIEARLGGKEPRLVDVVPDVEPLLVEICERATHVDPTMRYATADEFRTALQTFLFVSGESVDSATIGQALRTKFSTERAAMHRLIDVYIRSEAKEPDYTESMVRALRPVPTEEPGNEDPTTVADLSQLIQSSRPDSPRSPDQKEASGEQRSRRPVSWVLAGVAALVAATYVVARGHLTTTPEVQRVAPPVDISAPIVSVERPTMPPSLPVAASATEPAETAEPPSPSLGGTPRNPTEVSPRAMPPANHTTVAEPGRSNARNDVTRTTPARESAPNAALAAAPVVTAPSAAAPRDDKVQKQSMGDDLRQLKRHGTRTLDTEDPFQ
jgi:serine/threonine-protein kinase